MDYKGASEPAPGLELPRVHPVMAQALPGNRSLAGYSPGDVIASKYRLERMLGEGGVGAVWLARNLKLDSAVALKLIRPELDAPDAAERLLKEARAEAKLEHRAIVRAFDFGEAEHGNPFIVMELLEGQNFGSFLDDSPDVSAIKVARILLPVIEALAYAHEQGIVHRDLKPENVFLAREGKRLQPKIVDFGIAKLSQSDSVSDRTLGGVVLGTPAYMAPEQARGLADVDHRVDTWAVCVVLYEAITGSAPFFGDNYNAVMRSVIEDEPTPIVAWGIDEPELWQIIRVGLLKDRVQRWQSMRELGTALAAWLSSKGVVDDISGESIRDNWPADSAELPLPSTAPSSVPSSAPNPQGQQHAGQSKRLAWFVGVALLTLGVVWGLDPEWLGAAPPSSPKLTRLGERLAPRHLEASHGTAKRAEATPVPAARASAAAPPGIAAVAGSRAKKPKTPPSASASKSISAPHVPQPSAGSAGAAANPPTSDLKDPY